MTTQDFAYWLQGYVEISNGKMVDETQWNIIKDHLKEVFVKSTPDRYVPVRTFYSTTELAARSGEWTPAYPGQTPYIAMGESNVDISC
jgi:hypothetical protein